MTLILTPNDRLARYAKQYFVKKSNSLDKCSEPSYSVNNLSHWASNAWESACIKGAFCGMKPVVDALVERSIWMEAFTKVAEDVDLELFEASKHVDEVMLAHSLMLNYQVFNSQIKNSRDFYIDHQIFLLWKHSFESELKKRGFISSSMIGYEILQILEPLTPEYLLSPRSIVKSKSSLIFEALVINASGFSNSLFIEKDRYLRRIVLFGFLKLSLPPVWIQIFNKIRQLGIEVIFVSDLEDALSPSEQIVTESMQGKWKDISSCAEFKSDLHEIQTVSKYVADNYKENPNKRTAVVIPSLGKFWQQYFQEFLSAFRENGVISDIRSESTVDKSSSGSMDLELPFNISSGVSLLVSQSGLAFIQILKLWSSSLSTQEVVALLNSRKWNFLSTPQQQFKLALDFQSEHEKYQEIRFKDVVDFAKCKKYPLCVEVDKLKSLALTSSYELKLIAEFLGFGTTEENRLSRWEIKHLFSSLDRMDPIIACILEKNFTKIVNSSKKIIHQILPYLIKILGSTSLPMQESNSEEKNIHILGQLEVSGLEFDEVIVMEAQSDILPSRVSPNSFIPLSLQKKLKIERGSISREVDFANSWLELLGSKCKSIIFTYHTDAKLTQGDTTPSSFIQNLSQCEDILKIKNTIHQDKNSTVQIEKSLDCDVKMNFSSCLKGGTGRISSINNCYFQAFSKYCLQLEEFDFYESEKSSQRGKIIHCVLENYYKRYSESYSIQEFSLDSEIEDMVRSEMDDILVYRNGQFLQEQEVSYLTGEIVNFLKLENQARKKFRVVECEAQRSIEILGKELKIKLDRIDEAEVSEGKSVRVIVDYKHKRYAPVSMKNLLINQPQRLEDSQLPIYSIAEKEAETVVYELIHHKIGDGDKRFFTMHSEDIDISDDKRDFKIVIASIDKLRSLWKRSLEITLAHHLEGKVAVNPISESACQYCSFKNFCRR